MIKVTTVIWKGVTFDIIRLRDPNIAAVDRFDFGINQVWYDGKHMHTTKAFDLDERNNTLTYLNTAENYLRLDRIIKDRIPRMLEKFPHRKVRGLIQTEDFGWAIHSAVVQKLRRELLEIEEHLTPLEQIFLKRTEDLKGCVEEPPLKEDVDKLRDGVLVLGRRAGRARALVFDEPLYP